MEEAAGKAKSPDSVKLLLPPIGDTFIVTQDSIASVDKLSRRLDNALRLNKDAASSDPIERLTTGTKPEKRVRRRFSAVVDERLFWSTIIELSRSHNYRSLCLSKFRSKCQSCQWTRPLKSYSVAVTVVVKLVPSKPVIDMSWEGKIGHLVVQQLELENTMAWLSTLGGAFSALGDYDFRFAEAACQVSVKQLKLALHIGDPVTVCRCQIYLAMSLLQRGYFRSCRTLLRKQYKFAVSKEGQRDPKLAKMCQAVWIRMQYLRCQLEKQLQLEPAP
uniref:Uncharacterized protein n=1 Tax=Amblyomma aureolatum TaxID=187763 RepID=A0A1E1X635_9ACAR